MTFGGNLFQLLATRMVKKSSVNPFSVLCLYNFKPWPNVGRLCRIVLLLGHKLSQFYHTFLLGSCMFLSYLLISFCNTMLADSSSLTFLHWWLVSVT